MKIDQLPTGDRYFDPDNDYRPLLEEITPSKVRGVIHFRRPTAGERKRQNRKARTLGVNPEYIREGLMDIAFQPQRFDHIAIVVDHNGMCYFGEARVNDEDQYVRRYGFRLAVKRAFEAFKAEQADFSVGDDPPVGRLLHDMVGAKMKQHRI